jgi:transposase
MAVARRSVEEMVQLLGVSRAHVYRTVARFLDAGRDGLLDGRAANGRRVVDEAFRESVRKLLDGSPRDHGFIRSTWTRELLVLVMKRNGYATVSVCTMGRVLAALGARRGRPKPIVKCPLSARQSRRRIKQVRDLIANCPPKEVVVYEDEIDIHLNPKLGLDWMNRGHQKLILTPGKNEKAYVAGTLDARTRDVLWVGGGEKNSSLFVAMLRKLDAHYADADRIHVVLDNYGIHKSKMTKAALRDMPRIRLHFLPPYSPDDNLIERLWLDLHANVTRNHPHAELVPLCGDVARFLDHVSPWTPRERPLILEAA